MLTIYSDLPITGPQRPLMTSIYQGEELALDQEKASSHYLDITLATQLNDADPSTGAWSPTVTDSSATEAAQDPEAIAYIGDFNSGATATSLPITNRADMLQVSPSSPYVGLTDPDQYDVIGEPNRYYPSGIRTFARLVPSDVQEATATTRFMRWLGVTSVYVLIDNSPYNGPFDSAIAPIVASDAARAGITLAGSSQIDTVADLLPANYASIAATIAASGAAAVIVGAAPDAGSVALWQELYAKLPGVKLFAPSTLAIGPFLDKLGAAGTATFVTSPILPLSQYPRRSRAVLSAYRREFHSAPTAYTLYGYEAMRSILAAIKRAGGAHATRLGVVKAYFDLGERDKSVIGRYEINARGDTSLSQFAAYEIGADDHFIELRRFSGG